MVSSIHRVSCTDVMHMLNTKRRIFTVNVIPLDGRRKSMGPDGVSFGADEKGSTGIGAGELSG